jgi:mono/diheme cytochrome c family protein
MPSSPAAARLRRRPRHPASSRSPRARKCSRGTARAATAWRPRARPGAQPDRGRRGGSRLPGQHRPDARGRALRPENVRKPPVLDTSQTLEVAAYIAVPGGGPRDPLARPGQHRRADRGLGQQLFIANCAQCHNFVGAGGALTYGKFAPALTQATPTQIYEAMLTGPEAMPVFNDTTMTPMNKRDIIAYVTATRTEPTRAASAWAGSARSPRAWWHSSACCSSWCWQHCGSPRSKGSPENMSETNGHGELPDETPDETPAGPHRVIGTPPPAEARTLLGGREPDGDRPAPRELPADPADLRKAKVENDSSRPASLSRCWPGSASSPPTSAWKSTR